MTLGPIEAVRVFTTKLSEARRFYADMLGLPEIIANNAIAMFDTGQAKLIVEYVDPNNPETAGLVDRFTAFSFTVTNMETALNNLRQHSIEWIALSERQAWGVCSRTSKTSMATFSRWSNILDGEAASDTPPAA